MPKKPKGKFKPYRLTSCNDGAEIFRNASAVLDDIDPLVSLQYLNDIFKGRLDEDVVSMIFSECAYNVDQALETLESLCSDEIVPLAKESRDITDDLQINCQEKGNFNQSFSQEACSFSSNAQKIPKNSKLAIFPVSDDNSTLNSAHAEDAKTQFGAEANNNSLFNSSHNLGQACLLTEPDFVGIQTRDKIFTSADDGASEFSASSEGPRSYLMVAEEKKNNNSLPLVSSVYKFPPGSFQSGSRNYHSSSFIHNGSYKRDQEKFRDALAKIKTGLHVLVILRGLPGSGKSTLAKKLKFSGEVFSTDDFFVKNGEYLFDPYQLNEAHAWNKHRTQQALEKGTTPVIVDNTNVEAWEITPYVLLGKKYNYEIIILEPDTPWKFKVHELSLRNKHGIPKSKIARMKERYQHNITVEKILASISLLNANNINVFSEDSNVKKIVVKNKEGNVIDILNDNATEVNESVKVDVHQEEMPSDNMLLNLSSSKSFSSPNIDMTNNVSLENDNLLIKGSNYFDNKGSYFATNSVPNDGSTSLDLDELRALTQEDSEDSTSMYSFLNDSTQDISGWEAITEHDNDFLYSHVSKVLEESSNLSQNQDLVDLADSDNSSCPLSSSGVLNSSKVLIDKVEEDVSQVNLITSCDKTENSSKIIPNEMDLSLKEINSESECENRSPSLEDGSIETLWVDDEASDKNESKADTSSSPENLMSSLSDLQVSNADSKEFKVSSLSKPKPQRHQIECNIVLNEGECDPAFQEEKVLIPELNPASDWNIVEAENVQATEKRSNILIADSSSPKPQREMFNHNSLSFKDCNSLSASTKKRTLLNIHVDSLDSDWSFPDFIPSCFNEENKSFNAEIPLKASVCTQTELHDFILSHRADTDFEASDFEGCKILRPRPFKESVLDAEACEVCFDQQEGCIVPKIASFDKSTDTAGLDQDLEMSKKIDYLQNCFPDISLEDLQHLLEMCHNNETWLSNLLLEWGYKYNVPSKTLSIDSTLDKYSEEGRNSEITSSVEIPSENLNFENNAQCSGVSPLHDSEASQENEPMMLQLVLDSVFACQLQEIFGPVDCIQTEADFCVEIDFELAEILHKKWKNTVLKAKSKSKKVLSKGSNLSNSRNDSKNIIKKDLLSKDPKDLTFAEIMDMEYALQLQKEEKLKKDTDFVTKLKRLELYDMFPGADSVALDEIFESNNYSLKDTMFAIGEDLGKTEMVRIQQSHNIQQIDQKVTEWSNLNVFKDFEQGDWSEWVYQEDNIGSVVEATLPEVSSTISPEASDLRDVAAKHYRLRQELIGKAQAAYCRGMKDVASFYAQKAGENGQLFKEANKKASLLIKQQRNAFMSPNKIDLHGLHIKEAVSTLEKFIREKKNEIFQRKQTTPMTISVITGQGLHSIKGPKLRPSVIEYLKKTGYNFYEVDAGMVEVVITP